MDNGRKAPAYSLLTGFIGTAWISKALSDAGMADVAYRLLQQESYPSWLYPVTQGATTIWERLNSYTHLDGFGGNNRMNSFNHYSFGAVGAWMYNYSIGIQRDELSPGFKHFFLQPMPDPTGKMTSAQGYYDSMYGRIESSWKVEGRQVTYDFTIPTNTSATWRLPDGTARELTSGHYCFQIER
jgi:alpha-L-rhamnosidase